MRAGKLILTNTAKSVFELIGGDIRCSDIGLVPDPDAVGTITYGTLGYNGIPLANAVTVPFKRLDEIYVKSTSANDVVHYLISG